MPKTYPISVTYLDFPFLQFCSQFCTALFSFKPTYYCTYYSKPFCSHYVFFSLLGLPFLHDVYIVSLVFISAFTGTFKCHALPYHLCRLSASLACNLPPCLFRCSLISFSVPGASNGCRAISILGAIVYFRSTAASILCFKSILLSFHFTPLSITS